MSNNIIDFNKYKLDGISYIKTGDNAIIGVKGKNFEMEILLDRTGFLFNGLQITKEELIGLIMVSGLWEDVQLDSFDLQATTTNGENTMTDEAQTMDIDIDTILNSAGISANKDQRQTLQEEIYKIYYIGVENGKFAKSKE